MKVSVSIEIGGRERSFYLEIDESIADCESTKLMFAEDNWNFPYFASYVAEMVIDGSLRDGIKVVDHRGKVADGISMS